MIALYLGCGRQHLAGWVNCDLHPGPNVDAAFDVEKDWPFPDNHADQLASSHMLEHLGDPRAFFREAWRVSKPNAPMLLRLPYGMHRSAWWDLTHHRPWFVENFAMLQPGYGQTTGNPQHDAWRWPFGVSVDLRISGKWARYVRWRLARRYLLAYGDDLPGFGEELWVHCVALKTREAVERYEAAHQPNDVAWQWVIYEHQWQGRQNQAGEALTLRRLGPPRRSMAAFHNWR